MAPSRPVAGVPDVDAGQLGLLGQLAELFKSGWGLAAFFASVAGYLFVALRKEQGERVADLKLANDQLRGQKAVLDRVAEVMEQLERKTERPRR